MKEEIKPLDSVFVYSPQYKTIQKRTVMTIRISSDSVKYILDCNWEVCDWQVSKNINILVNGLIKLEESRHLIEMNKLKSLCVA